MYKVFFHVAEIRYGSYNVFAPVLLNESRNIPNTRISSDEYGYLGTRGSSPPGWNMLTFKIQNTIAAASPLWLGMISSGIGISFDYGADYFDIMGSLNTVTAKTNITNGQSIGGLLNNCGMYIPQYLEALEYGDDEWVEELRSSVHYQRHNVHPKSAGRYDFKFSYYFQPDGTTYTRTLTAGVTLTDVRKPAGTYKRRVAGQGAVTDGNRHTGGYIRGLYTAAGSLAETEHRAEYHRKQRDAVSSHAVSLRHLFIFIRLLTGAYIRDYIIGRFLKSKEELIIKSPVCREIILESTLH
jgi:hypothetical protein